MWIALLVAALVIWFITANSEDANVSFMFFDAVVPLWLALAITGVGGFLVGMLFGRRRR